MRLNIHIKIYMDNIFQTKFIEELKNNEYRELTSVWLVTTEKII